MAQQLIGHLEHADQTPSILCVVITGVGDQAFSSGHDLSEILDQGEAGLSPESNRAFTAPAQMVKPTIAAVNGAAYAGGLIQALSCDLRVASKDARFCVSGARVGLLPIGGQLVRLPRLMPYARALEMILSAEPISVEEAHAVGFINQLVSKGGALSASLELAEKIAANSPSVVQEAKKGVEVSLRHGFAAGEAFEWETGPSLATTLDAEEGIRAFLEKRRPKFADK